MTELSAPARCTLDRGARTQLAVLPVAGAWTILVNGELNGRFDDQEAALGCILSMLERPWLRGSVHELLVSSPAGEVLNVPV